MELWSSLMEGSEGAKLGFGCMRFPMDPASRKLDRSRAKRLIQTGMEQGLRYYDTAWPYHEGENEPVLGEILAEYDRESYCLVTKLPCWQMESLEQVRQTMERQLRRLRTEYLDGYLLHSLTQKTWNKMEQLGVLSLLEEYRQKGVLRHLGFSFHDRYEVFETILLSRKWDLCQIQLNYMDVSYQAGLKGLELARSRGVPVVGMEPVKGGALARLPEEAALPLRELDPGASDASWALRWVASQPGVRIVLSGMAEEGEIRENRRLFSPLVPLNREERAAVEETARRLRLRIRNGCTGCRYCLPCPEGVDIPQIFRIWNDMGMYGNDRLTRRTWRSLDDEERPERCVGCGRCEGLCPQHIPVRAHLAQAKEEISRRVEETATARKE